jgi:hypothetical protein
MVGNKGGVMVSFKIFETSFCFISCHLAARPSIILFILIKYYQILVN